MNSAFNSKSARTHDSFYADQTESEPKESFKAILNLIQKKYFQSSVNLIDIGCACGDFPGFLSKASGLSVCGMDSLPLLISQASIRYPGIQFIEGSIEDKTALPDNSYEIITVLGVLSIFDDLTSICMNLSKWIKIGGTIYVHGMFNPDPIDVFIRYKHAIYGQPGGLLESGWNIISQHSFEKLFLENGAQRVVFHKFNLEIDLAKQNDPVRSWTEPLANGSKQIVNGLCLNQPQYIAEISF